MPEPVILLHGLWLHCASLTLLRRRLLRAGYAAETFPYHSVTTPTANVLDALRARMRAHPDGVHLVGHSLGGLLALLACRGAADLPPGRIVCLGSPLAGSAAARRLDAIGGARLLGRNRTVLECGLECWDGSRQAGMVAGNVGIGLGAMLAHFAGGHDGVVALRETRLPGLAGHCVVAASHAALPFSRVAALQTVAFLRHGTFTSAAPQADR